MVSLVLLAVLAGGAAVLYLKGTLAQGLMMILNAILASFIAFGFFELVAGLLAKYAAAVTAWAQTISFLLLFVLAFAVLQTIAMQLHKQKIDLGLWPERVGRVICGLILGYIVAGQLLVGAALAPLPSGYPYARFSERGTNPSQPSKTLLNPDGFVVGLFATISKGSFSAIGEPKSFAMLHAGFLNELYLNRLKGPKEVPLRTKAAAIEVPRQGAVREAPASLRDTEGNPPPSRSGETLTLVTVAFKSSQIVEAGKLTLSQVRLICRPKGADQARLAGKGQALYPVGYIASDGSLVLKPLSEQITIEAPRRGGARNVEFAFFVPTHLTPTLLGLKGNNLEQVSLRPAADDAAPTREGEETSPPSRETDETRQPTGESDSTSSTESDRDGRGLSNLGTALTGGALEEDIMQ